MFVIVDDHQFDALGAADHPDVKTPVLDALAERGVRFSQATNMGSLMPAICSPARACQLTGLHPFRANTDPRPGGGNLDFVTIPGELPTVPELFGQAGYETFCTGKWHNDPATLLRSFDRADSIFVSGMCPHEAVPLIDRAGLERGEVPQVGKGFSTEIFCDVMVDFLSTRDEAKPFFAWLALTSPHDPRTPPPEFRDWYDPAQLTLPTAFRPEPSFDNGELAVRDEKLLSKPLTEDAMRADLANYYGMISHHDHHLGRVFSELRALGQEDNTIVVYIGDHGLAMGRLLGKQNLYEHSIRVPLIMAGPGIAEGAVANGLVYSLDISATLLELAGIEAPPEMTSLSMVSQLREPESAGRAELFSFYKNCQRALRDEQWKLIEYQVEGRSVMELFNLEDDPDELTNQSHDPLHSHRIQRMRRRLCDEQEQFGDTFMYIDLDATPWAAC